MHRNSISSIPVGLFLLDQSYHVLDANEPAAEALGVHPDELKGRSFEELLDPESVRACKRHLQRAERTGRRESVRVELKHADGRAFLADLFTSAEKRRDEEGVIFRTALVTIAAELIRAKEEAEQMSRLKSAFLANMSHEIRTPLTGIIGFASVLAKEAPPEQREFAELIHASGKRLMEMLNSVLDLAKLESNQMNLDAKQIRLVNEVREVIEILAPSAEEKGLVISIELDGVDEDAEVRLDRGAVNRILYNLIGNAIKFTDQGQVSIRVWKADDRVGFDISDTGIGIEPEFLPYLFDDFSQESIGMNRSHPGTGLGLAITRRLVDLLSGEIQVQSEKYRGTTFRVAFPITLAPIDDGRKDAGTVPQSVPDSTSTVSILLVEDNPETQQLLIELLEELYEVTVVGNASAALQAAGGTTFDLVLMDIHLGRGPDGTELLKKLRRMPGYADTPIVAVTAYALPGDRERFLEQGFTAYVSKPFDVDELLQLPFQLS